MKSLKDILYGVGLSAVSGSTSVLVNEICFDSRNVGKDDNFVAIKGGVADGHAYIEKAIAAGANSIVCEALPKMLINGVTYVAVDNAHTALSKMTANYYGNPRSEEHTSELQ